MLLENNCVIVTGGGQGIGRAIVDACVREGARVVSCDISAESVRKLHAPDRGVHAFRTDVSVESEVERLFEDALTVFNGRLDAMVNNAGVAGPTGPMESYSLEDWKSTFEVNVHSSFLCLRRAIPVMKQARSGCILNISSTAGLMGYPLRTPYAAAKWGLIGMTKSLAMELGPHGVRVNAICPGSVDGPRMDRVIASEASARGVAESEVRAGYVRQVSMRTFIDAEDIAETVVYLCSDKALRISGQALSVDGHNETLTTVDF